MDIMLDIRLAIFAVVISIAGYCAWDYHETKVKNIALAQQNAVSQAVIADQKETAAITAKSDAVTTAANTIVAQQNTETDSKISSIQSGIDQKVQAIEDKAQGRPVTIASEKALDDATAAVQLDGMWQVYCGDASTVNLSCPVQTTPVANDPAPSTSEPSFNSFKTLIPTITIPDINLPDTTAIEKDAVEKLF